MTYPLSQPATAFAFGNLEGDTTPDLAILEAGNVFILHGSDLPSSGPVQGSAAALEAVSLPFPVKGFTLGRFISTRDSRTQMALLSSDGSVHVAASGAFDTTPFSAAERRANRSKLLADAENWRKALLSGQPDPTVTNSLSQSGAHIGRLSKPLPVQARARTQRCKHRCCGRIALVTLCRMLHSLIRRRVKSMSYRMLQKTAREWALIMPGFL